MSQVRFVWSKHNIVETSGDDEQQTKEQRKIGLLTAQCSANALQWMAEFGND